jgi:hypothetical protein
MNTITTITETITTTVHYILHMYVYTYYNVSNTYIKQRLEAGPQWDGHILFILYAVEVVSL